MNLKLMVAHALARKERNKQPPQLHPALAPVLQRLAALAHGNQGADLRFSSLQHIIREKDSRATPEQIAQDIVLLVEAGVLTPLLFTADDNDLSEIPDEFCLTEEDNCILSTQNVLSGTEQAIHPNSGEPIPIEKIYVSFQICPDWRQKMAGKTPD